MEETQALDLPCNIFPGSSGRASESRGEAYSCEETSACPAGVWLSHLLICVCAVPVSWNVSSRS